MACKSPSVITTAPSPFERLYSPKDLAELWQLSEQSIRRLFADEPGVLAVRDPGRSGRARYVHALGSSGGGGARLETKGCVHDPHRSVPHTREQVPRYRQAIKQKPTGDVPPGWTCEPPEGRGQKFS